MIKKENREVEVIKKEVKEVEVEYCDLCGREISKNGVERGEFSITLYHNYEVAFEEHPSYIFCKECAEVMTRMVSHLLTNFIIERYGKFEKLPAIMDNCRKYIIDNGLDDQYVLNRMNNSKIPTVEECYEDCCEPIKKARKKK